MVFIFFTSGVIAIYKEEVQTKQTVYKTKTLDSL